MKILIISQLFEPLNEIGAVRPTKLAYFLCKNGYSVDVFTSSYGVNKVIDINSKPYRLVYDRPVQLVEEQIHRTAKGIKRTNKQDGRLLKEAKKTYRQILAIKKGKMFAADFKKAVDEGSIYLSDYDFVFSTFGPIGSTYAGIVAKRKSQTIKWISDFRDPLVSKEMPVLLLPYLRWVQNYCVKNADHVTTVSYGYKKRIELKKLLKEVVVIPNGYDTNDFKNNVDEPSSFSFAYVGALYEGKRNLGSLFEGIKAIIDSGIVARDVIKFNYAGRDFEFLYKQAEQYGLEDILVNHGIVSRETSFVIQAMSRYLVLSTWNEKGEEGVFPGKLIEYMLMRKPVISIVCGNLPSSEVTEVIHELGLGYSYETMNPSKKQEFANWLLSEAERFRDGLQSNFRPNFEEIDKRYNWNSIVKLFEEIMNG